MPKEIALKVNQLLFDDQQDVTTSAQQIKDIYTIPATVTEIKTVVLSNLSSNDIAFGKDNSVSTSNGGGILRAGETREFPLIDLEYSPFFIAGSNSALGIEIWG